MWVAEGGREREREDENLAFCSLLTQAEDRMCLILWAKNISTRDDDFWERKKVFRMMNYLAECEFARRGVSFTLREAKIVMKFKGAQICVYAWAFFVLLWENILAENCGAPKRNSFVCALENHSSGGNVRGWKQLLTRHF
jgi:hypothetical protein